MTLAPPSSPAASTFGQRSSKSWRVHSPALNPQVSESPKQRIVFMSVLEDGEPFTTPCRSEDRGRGAQVVFLKTCPRLLTVDGLLQRFACPEFCSLAGRQLDWLAGLGIARFRRFASRHGECAEADKADVVAAPQCPHDVVE